MIVQVFNYCEHFKFLDILLIAVDCFSILSDFRFINCALKNDIKGISSNDFLFIFLFMIITSAFKKKINHPFFIQVNIAKIYF